jgi:large subunit ribosomal protein L6
MSRVGKKSIDVPSGVDVAVSGDTVTVKGPKGELSLDLPEAIRAEVGDGSVQVSRADDSRENRSFHGLYRSLIANMIEGVEKGFARSLRIEGVGFRAEVRGKVLVLTVGYSSPVEYDIPDTVTIGTDNNGTRIDVSGTDKQQVGLVAARIRAFAPAEPYKGKGISYLGERVRRKVGKTVA